MRAAKLLRDARAILAEGWTQHDLERETAPRRFAYCVTGALDRAWLADPRAQTGDLAEATNALALQIEPNFTGQSPRVRLIKWNDAAERTHGDVLATLDRAIAQATP